MLDLLRRLPHALLAFDEQTQLAEQLHREFASLRALLRRRPADQEIVVAPENKLCSDPNASLPSMGKAAMPDLSPPFYGLHPFPGCQ